MLSLLGCRWLITLRIVTKFSKQHLQFQLLHDFYGFQKVRSLNRFLSYQVGTIFRVFFNVKGTFLFRSKVSPAYLSFQIQRNFWSKNHRSFYFLLLLYLLINNSDLTLSYSLWLITDIFQ
jgi:hypothetical protein